jgi:hypothetical protein
MFSTKSTIFDKTVLFFEAIIVISNVAFIDGSSKQGNACLA